MPPLLTDQIGAANPRHGTVMCDLAMIPIAVLTLPLRSRPTAPETMLIPKHIRRQRKMGRL